MACLHSRAATEGDLPLLAQMNKRLIEDERARNPMSIEQLEQRMRRWLERGEYQAELFTQGDSVVGYALYQLRPDEYFPEQTEVYVRHFYVEREHRRRGVGRSSMQLLASKRFPTGCTVAIDVLATNPGGYQFWCSLGFAPYLTAMKTQRERLLGN